jgi:hypothetical protein
MGTSPIAPAPPSPPAALPDAISSASPQASSAVGGANIHTPINPLPSAPSFDDGRIALNARLENYERARASGNQWDTQQAQAAAITSADAYLEIQANAFAEAGANRDIPKMEAAWINAHDGIIAGAAARGDDRALQTYHAENAVLVAADEFQRADSKLSDAKGDLAEKIRKAKDAKESAPENNISLETQRVKDRENKLAKAATHTQDAALTLLKGTSKQGDDSDVRPADDIDVQRAKDAFLLPSQIAADEAQEKFKTLLRNSNKLEGWTPRPDQVVTEAEKSERDAMVAATDKEKASAYHAAGEVILKATDLEQKALQIDDKNAAAKAQRCIKEASDFRASFEGSHTP